MHHAATSFPFFFFKTWPAPRLARAFGVLQCVQFLGLFGANNLCTLWMCLAVVVLRIVDALGNDQTVLVRAKINKLRYVRVCTVCAVIACKIRNARDNMVNLTRENPPRSLNNFADNLVHDHLDLVPAELGTVL
eukprot:7633400-Lingulodinium_polyedra.AAC.1